MVENPDDDVRERQENHFCLDLSTTLCEPVGMDLPANVRRFPIIRTAVDYSVHEDPPTEQIAEALKDKLTRNSDVRLVDPANFPEDVLRLSSRVHESGVILLAFGLFTPEKSPGEGYDFASLAPPLAGSSPEDLAQQVAAWYEREWVNEYRSVAS